MPYVSIHSATKVIISARYSLKKRMTKVMTAIKREHLTKYEIGVAVQSWL